MEQRQFSYFKQAQGHQKKGELRKAISQYRQVLRFEEDHFIRAKVYIELARIYRLMIRMKNARLEIFRAFKEINLRAPQNTLTSFLKSVFFQNEKLHPDFLKRSKEEQSLLIANMYEELGLSAYYLRHNLIMVQSTILSKKFCHQLGPSRPLLNWYGGTACVLAIIGLKQKSLQYMKRCHEISIELKSSNDLGKSLIWKALLYDYSGFPVRSAELFERCMKDHGKDLDSFDLQICAVTLSVNLFSRGHFLKSIEVLKNMKELNPSFYIEDEFEKADIISWYSLGPSMMLGQKVDIPEILQNFKSIMSNDRDEKWIITQFIGHLLIAARKTGFLDIQFDDLVKRFKILKMSPAKTHFESTFYWFTEAYYRMDQALNDNSKLKMFEKSIENLERTPSHPTGYSHLAVLKAAYFGITKNRNSFNYWSQKAADDSRLIDNQWALAELNHIQGVFRGKI